MPRGKHQPGRGNHLGTRWRGQLPIPAKAHPFVRILIQEANEQQTVLSEIGSQSGVAPQTISGWRYRSEPSLCNLEAALQVLGLELCVRDKDTGKVLRCGSCSENVNSHSENPTAFLQAVNTG